MVGVASVSGLIVVISPFHPLAQGPFGFVEFDDYRDAEDAVYYLDGKDMDGGRLIVQHARGPRPMMGGGGFRGGFGGYVFPAIFD